MIKNIVLTVFLHEKSIKDISSRKKSFFILSFGITNIVFPILFNIFLSITVKKYSFIDYLGISLLEIKDNLIFNLLLFGILSTLFYVQSNKQWYFKTIFKAVVAMNYIHPIMAIISYYIGNIIFYIAFIIYDIIFLKIFIKENISNDELTPKKQFICIVSTFIIMLFVYGFIYKILLLN